MSNFYSFTFQLSENKSFIINFLLLEMQKVKQAKKLPLKDP